MFNFLKKTLTKIYTQVSTTLAPIFGKKEIDADSLEEIQKILLNADTGTHVTKIIVEELKKRFNQGRINSGQQLKEVLATLLIEACQQDSHCFDANIIILVGINGSGKTTFAGKLAAHYTKQGKQTLLVAADTFRAAAVEQLGQWAERSGAHFLKGSPEQDPAAVVFKGCDKFNREKQDILIIDTAGRLQTKNHLMQELGKIKRVLSKQLPNAKICTLLTIDAMLGQNSFEQAKIFHEIIPIDGIVLTKLDGTGKGGIVFRIQQELGIPITYISYGEQADAMALFNAQTYVEQLLAQ